MENGAASCWKAKAEKLLSECIEELKVQMDMEEESGGLSSSTSSSSLLLPVETASASASALASNLPVIPQNTTSNTFIVERDSLEFKLIRAKEIKKLKKKGRDILKDGFSIKYMVS